MTDRPTILELGSRRPHLNERAWLAPTATVIGDVTVAAEASVFYGAVVRADMWLRLIHGSAFRPFHAARGT